MRVSVRPPAYQVLADSLRAQIISGELRPGDRLPTEPQLCMNSGVSRSTVREALRLLASQNLIITTRGVTGGSFVVHPSTLQLSEVLATSVGLMLSTEEIQTPHLFEVREMFEVPAAGLAAGRRTAEDLEAMRVGLFDPRMDSLDTKIAQHRVFHLALAKASGNALCELISRALYPVVDTSGRSTALSADFWVRADAEHRDILAAVAAANPSGAEGAARRHLAHLRAEFDGETGWGPSAADLNALTCVL